MTDEPRREPTEEELRMAFEEQMKQITVRDVLLQTAITLINIAARRLGLTGEEGANDLNEARAAIEGVRALTPLLPPEEQQAVKEPLSQLQMRYAQEARGKEQAEPGTEAPAPGTPHPTPDTPHPTPDTPHPTPDTANQDAEREKARSKIWTPPGT